MRAPDEKDARCDVAPSQLFVCTLPPPTSIGVIVQYISSLGMQVLESRMSDLNDW